MLSSDRQKHRPRRRQTPILVPLVVVLAVRFCSADVVPLRADSYDEATSGKTVFVNFCTSWSAHCKRLDPEWTELGKLWDAADDESVGLIGYVDCSSKSERPLCDRFRIRGFPTLKYGSPQDLMEYSGGRTLEDLTDFARSSLVPLCSPHDLDACDNETRLVVDVYMSMPLSDLEDLLTGEKRKLREADAAFEEKVKELQARYETIERDRDEAIARIREGELGTIQSVYAARVKLQQRSDGQTDFDRRSNSNEEL